MFDRKGLKKLQKPSRKGRKVQEWEHATKKDQERRFQDKKKEGRRPIRRIEDDDKVDWRDLLAEEEDDSLHGG